MKVTGLLEALASAAQRALTVPSAVTTVCAGRRWQQLCILTVVCCPVWCITVMRIHDKRLSPAGNCLIDSWQPGMNTKMCADDAQNLDARLQLSHALLVEHNVSATLSSLFVFKTG
jgi:hypothetical protein